MGQITEISDKKYLIAHSLDLNNPNFAVLKEDPVWIPENDIIGYAARNFRPSDYGIESTHGDNYEVNDHILFTYNGDNSEGYITEILEGGNKFRVNQFLLQKILVIYKKDIYLIAEKGGGDINKKYPRRDDTHLYSNLKFD
jgi:hypothetical protein